MVKLRWPKRVAVLDHGHGPLETAKTAVFRTSGIAMHLQLVLAALLALPGLSGALPLAHDSSAPQEHVVGQTVAAASAGIATADLSGAPAAPPDGVSLKKLAVVVPPVDSSDVVAAPGGPLENQAAAGAVVADQLVAPKRVESEVVKVVGFQTVGVTWPAQAEVGDLGAQVRTRSQGRWSKWVDLEPSDSGPDAGTAEAAMVLRGGTDPVSIGDADAVQLAFTASAKGGPKGLNLALVGSSQKPASGGEVGSTAGAGATISSVGYSAGVVQAVSAAPAVITRAQWGAPAARPNCAEVASKLVGAVVHHTAGPNTYTTTAQAKQQIRNDAAYHINSLGWCDLGYNFVVDKWGNIYEGRAYSMTKAVIGAHAGGFNTSTVGVAMLGTYGAAPSAATQRSVAQIIGWRLGAYLVDPKTSMTYHAGDDVGAKYRNQNVVLPRVMGHRDVWSTACPGNGGYSALPGIRAMASTYSRLDVNTPTESVVTALYQDLLGRSPDATGLKMWATRLAGGTDQSELVSLITRSDEYIGLRVAQAYREVLGREPEGQGAASWLKQIRAGQATVDDVQRRFFDSQEFISRSGGTDNGYVANMYRSILGRAATAGEVDLWVAKLDQSGRGWVVDQIWFSLEAASARAGGYYELFLKRAPDTAGRASWARVLLAHGEGAVRTGIAGSQEYRARAIIRYP